MSGLSPKLPVQKDSVDGFVLNKTYKDAIQQNLKNLVLTSPGERIMDPDFGVGMRRFLFEQNVIEAYELIEERVESQVETYMPFVEITQIIFSTGASLDEFEQRRKVGNVLYNRDMSPNKVNVRIEYFVTSLGFFNVLEVPVTLV
tara:strand:- start:177 stop:611 length:435 start_codon:yes stop_codon:yes gene_type:complete